MGTPEFPDLGKHCSVEDCRQIDFLPFTCDRCNKVFCLQHRSFVNHRCPNANQKDVTVVVCPLCAKGVRLIPNEDPNITWESHINRDCDPSNYERVTKKKRCPVPGCKELLTFSNTVRCRDCAQEHCLKHRFGPDHKCPGPKKSDPGFPFINMLSGRQKQDSLSNKTSSSSSWWSKSFSNVTSSFRSSAEASMLKFSNVTTQALQRAKDGMSQSSNSTEAVEQCIQCQARFSTVSALIEHAESTHQQNRQPIHHKMTVNVCPKCYKGFRDPVLLVEHVEKEHGGTSFA